MDLVGRADLRTSEAWDTRTSGASVLSRLVRLRCNTRRRVRSTHADAALEGEGTKHGKRGRFALPAALDARAGRAAPEICGRRAGQFNGTLLTTSCKEKPRKS